MKVLLISNMFPSSKMPYSGIFIRNQYTVLSKLTNVDIHYLKSKKTGFYSSIYKYSIFALKFVKYVFKKYDIVHVHFFSYHFLLSIIYKIFWPKAIIIVTFHGSDLKYLNSNLLKYFIKYINLIIAVGKDQKIKIESLVINIRVFLLPCGIDNSIFFYKKNTKKYDFIYIGNFFKDKGVDLIIDTLSDDYFKNYSFCFIGQGYLEKKIFLLKENINLTILSPRSQSELSNLLNQSKYLLFPSFNDSFGLVVTEALFCGVPAIVSNLGGMKDQIIHNKNGYILETNNTYCLTSYMKKCINLSYEDELKLRINAINSNKYYSLDVTCNRLLKIYKILLNNNLNAKESN